MENRLNNRIIYVHYLTVKFRSDFSRGNIMDLSMNGMQFHSRIALEKEKYRVRFHIEKERNVNEPLEIWTREGVIQWSRKRDNGYLMGVQFDPELDIIPAQHKSKLYTEPGYIRSLIDAYDMCQIFIFPSTFLGESPNEEHKITDHNE
ncbi:PilZ domain-containing protein [Deltaproteobacteria bacterium TL4]